ncbi:MAG: methyltransferase domain-containing protein [Bacteroidales bacterium]|nr:methyltransferase domain-containing protein [Bacteroidales bacterium]
MLEEYYQIKDQCRAGLLKYMAEAVSLLPKINNPKILDIGCGTGVPTIWLAENYGGKITAIDTDVASLEWLQVKIIDRKLVNKITAINISFFDLKAEPCYFDIILAEGFLNIVGFEPGFMKVLGLVKKEGYFLIHDEYKDHEMKCDFISNNHCEMVGTVFLDESVWWNEYYRQLEAEIASPGTNQMLDLFRTESKELELYRKDPSPFRSIYYVVRKL